MEEIIKDILYYISLIIGSIAIISLLIVVTMRCICILLDHLKAGNVIKKALELYIKENTKIKKIKAEDVDLSRMGIKRSNKDV